jgi:hypothetical protein
MESLFHFEYLVPKRDSPKGSLRICKGSVRIVGAPVKLSIVSICEPAGSRASAATTTEGFCPWQSMRDTSHRVGSALPSDVADDFQ